MQRSAVLNVVLCPTCREGGWKALYTGVGPRSIKAGPSVGIIVSFYEIMKHLLGRRVDLRS